MVLVYRREHPGNRCSYGIAGNKGIVVFDKGLFAGGPEVDAPPTITLDCEMVPVKADQKEEKARKAADKAADKLAKAQAKIEKAQATAAAKADKAKAALAKAQDKVAAAQKTAAA
jgi:hypothetical protein